MIHGSKMLKAAVTLSMVLGVASSCRPTASSPDSNAKSLDGLVSKSEGAQAVENSCGVPFTAVKDLPKQVQILLKEKRITGSAAMKKQVAGTLAAAPIDLIRPFVAAGGVINVTASEAEAERLCSVAPMTSEEKSISGAKVQSCWVGAQIVLPPVAARIRSDLLRQLSFYFTENVVEKTAAALEQGEGQAWTAAVTSTRNDLMNAFMADIQTSNAAAFNKLNKALAAERRAHFVYAEAIDSYYCSSATKSTFQARYPKAWAVFTDKANVHSPVGIFGE